MFIAVTSGDDRTTERVDRWAAEAWPNAATVRAHGWTVWTDGRARQQAFVTADSVVVADGVIWRGPRNWDAGTADTLAAELPMAWPLAPDWDGSFGVAVLAPGAATVAVDPAGMRRLFRATDGATLAVGSLQLPCAIAIRARPDPVGVAQILSLTHTVGHRTLFTACEEVLPGQCIAMRAGGGSRAVGFEPAVEPGIHPGGLSVGEAAELLVPLLRTCAVRGAAAFDSVGLALSGGLDSRLVLGALLPNHPPDLALSYGHPADRDVRVPARLARASGVPHHVVDLRGHLFPPLSQARAHALASEATWQPGWLTVNPRLAALGCDVLLMGDATDSLQVRGQAYWGRRERLRRQVRRVVTPWREDEVPSHYTDPATWWDAWRARVVRRVLNRLEVLDLEIDRDELRRATDADLDALWHAAELDALPTALQVEDALDLFVTRQQAGLKVNGTGPAAVGHSVFAVRSAVRAARSLPLDIRKDRTLMLELSRRMLPRALRRLPTATIPMVPVTSPMPIQNAVWAARFTTDAALRRVNRLAHGRLPRERIAKTLELPAEYRAAGPHFFLAEAWGASGVFRTQRYQDEFLAMVAGTKVPMVPMEQYAAVRVDTLLAALDHA